MRGGGRVAGVGPGAQLVEVAALGQQPDQPGGGVLVAGVGQGAQYLNRSVQVAALGQQVGQPGGGVPVAGVGQGAQYLNGSVQVAALGQQPGQPGGGVPVAGVGGMMVQQDGVAVQQPVAGAVSEPGGVGGIADVAEDGVPAAGGHADIAAFPAGMLDQVVRHDVPRNLAHVSSGRAKRGRGAMQLAGGVGQGLLEPVARRLGTLLAGAITRRGGTQQVGAQRGTGAEPSHIQRRGEHRPRVRPGGLGVLPAGYQLRRGCQGLGQPVPGRLQRDRQPPVTGGSGAGPVLLGRAELRADADDIGKVQQFPFPRARIGAPRFRHGGVGGVPVRP